MAFGRKSIASVFTDEVQVQTLTASVMIILSVANLFDGLQCYCQGPIRALGLQSKAAFIALGCYYIVSIPLAAIFAFWCGWSVYGLWGG